MNHVIPHDLPLDVAQRATREALTAYAEKFAKYEPRVDWTDDAHARVSFRAKGISVTGAVVVGPRSIDVDLEVPLLLRPFRGRAVEVIDREVSTWLARARAGAA